MIIQGEDFEDLDEIMTRYISQMASYVREIIGHKNFRSETQLRSGGGGDASSQDSQAVVPPSNSAPVKQHLKT